MYLLLTVSIGSLTYLYYFLPYYLDPYGYRWRFPGPWIARFSNLWLSRTAQAGKRQTAVDDMHKRFGKSCAFVRIAPNHISIADPAALEAVYGHSSRLLKSDFYDVFFTHEADTFSTQDRATHAKLPISSVPKMSLPLNHAYNNTSGSSVSNGIFVAMPRHVVTRGTTGLLRMGDCVAQFGYLSFDVIGDLALGSSFGMIEAQRDATPLRNNSNNRTSNVPIVELTLAVAELGTVVGAWPAWVRPFVQLLSWNYSRYKGLVDFIKLTVAKLDEKLERVKREIDEPVESNPMVDIIDKLLQLKGENGASLSRQELISEAYLFLFAGGDTTSTTLGAFCYFMAAHREAQLKLQDELDEHIPLQPGLDHDSTVSASTVVASHEQVKDLPCLNACLKEVMRLQSIVGMGLPRVVPPGQTFTFKGHTFKAGSVISVPGMTINHMDIWGPDAKTFRPERWLEPDALEFKKYYLPFSLGARACLGRNLATMQLLVVTATLFRRYDILLAPSQSGREIRLHEAMQRKVEHCDVAIKLRK